MFERFTDRSRKVLALANQEAQRFNHEYIGTEHILLGLVKEGSGVGARTAAYFRGRGAKVLRSTGLAKVYQSAWRRRVADSGRDREATPGREGAIPCS